VPVQDYQEGFSEAGIQIDNLLRSNFTALGIGGFCRFGPLALPESKDNIAIKLSAIFLL
ncbi:MAG: hypothetical protein HKN32_02205, partial [Flavobacteriales bacterium]|nr:hypothetical protein [Flavobacteriales bacterium]